MTVGKTFSYIYKKLYKVLSVSIHGSYSLNTLKQDNTFFLNFKVHYANSYTNSL